MDHEKKTAGNTRDLLLSPKDKDFDEGIRKLLCKEQVLTDFWSRDTTFSRRKGWFGEEAVETVVCY